MNDVPRLNEWNSFQISFSTQKDQDPSKEKNLREYIEGFLEFLQEQGEIELYKTLKDSNIDLHPQASAYTKKTNWVNCLFSKTSQEKYLIKNKNSTSIIISLSWNGSAKKFVDYVMKIDSNFDFDLLVAKLTEFEEYRKDKTKFKWESVSQDVLDAACGALKEAVIILEVEVDRVVNTDDKTISPVQEVHVEFVKEGPKEEQKIVSLKNSNAKRAFEFEINNSYHLKIVKNYIENLNNYKIKFLFPDITKNNKIYKYRVIKISKIDRINTILQKTTKRYTVIHSFRHTYVTNEIKKILSKKEKKIEDMYNLIYKIGHNDPETTIKNYAHLDLYFLDI